MDALRELHERLQSQRPSDPFFHQPTVLSNHPSPFWGAPNSLVDWCEPNYTHTRYVAEFWNTLSSFPMIVAGLIGLGCCRRYRLERRFWCCYAMLMTVGVGSVLFHGTLQWWGQAADELPMIYASAAYFYATVEANVQQTRRPWLYMAELLYCLFFTVAYFGHPQFFVAFVVVYGVSVTLVIYQGYRIYVNYFASDQSSAGRRSRILFYLAGSLYPGAFLFLWVPENLLCLAHPWVDMLHMHALFHVLTTISPVCFAAFLTYHRCKNVLKYGDVRHFMVGGLMPCVEVLCKPE